MHLFFKRVSVVLGGHDLCVFIDLLLNNLLNACLLNNRLKTKNEQMCWGNVETQHWEEHDSLLVLNV